MNKLFQQLTGQQTTNNENQIQQVLNMVRESNMSPKDLFYKKAQEMGVNPDSILNQLR